MSERLLTPSKISAFLECEHYVTLDRQAEAGIIERGDGGGSMARLLMDKGLAHEQDCLTDYCARGLSVFEVPGRSPKESFAQWVARVGNPLADGHDVIYQMPFVHDGMRGVADFLERVVDPETGVARYEPLDAKLARQEAKVGHVLQLCFYADAIEALTGVAPKHLRIWLGSGKVEQVSFAKVRAYWRRERRSLAELLADDGRNGTQPHKCTHCDFCEFYSHCDQQWRSEDSLIFVANISKADRAALTEAGTRRLEELATSSEPVEGIRTDRLERVRAQAGLQLEARDAPDQLPPFQHLPINLDAEPHGFRALPEPDDGDMFLDYEGHPFWRADTGLFFLFGLLTRQPDSGEWTYEARWAHDQAGEARATGELIAYLEQRREAHPGMHVYHYNHTERSSLLRLSIEHAAGEATLINLIDTGLFIDLFSVATHALQAGVESYGLKHLERLAGFERSDDIHGGAGAVIEYERYCGDSDATRLTRIATYNEDDVRATRALRDWLIEQRPDDLPWRPSSFDLPETEHPEIDEQVARLHEFPPDSPEYLLGHLLGYWLREGRAVMRSAITKTKYEPHVQFDDPEVLAGLEFVEFVPRFGKKGKELSVPAARFSLPEQAIGTKLREGGKVIYFTGEESLGFTSTCGMDDGFVDLLWNDAAKKAGVNPTMVVLNPWLSPKPKPQALSALAAEVLANDAADPPGRAAMSLLRRELPRFVDGGGPPDGRFTDDPADMQRWILELDGTAIAIQGPPGTGKTHTGAHLIHQLVLANRRVGITAMSHSAIRNLLDKVVEVFTEADDLERLRAIRKTDDDPKGQADGPVKLTTKADHCASSDYNLVAGTTWLFANEMMQASPVDVLFIDEAGQLALADALAAAGAANNLVLLGDPQQLAQVAQGDHPAGAGASVLEHVLAGEATIGSDRGVFLSESWRMHPDICGFISEQFYDGRLRSHERCARQDTGAGTGLRWIKAEHTGCSTESQIEADLISERIREMLDQTWTQHDGTSRLLTAGDFMVVAPYNDQVNLIRSVLDRKPDTMGVTVGTVDRFQGREAPVVFFSLTASSSSDVPRGLGFLLSTNRLNVAISRSQALAIVICTDALLRTRTKSISEVHLLAAVNSAVSTRAE